MIFFLRYSFALLLKCTLPVLLVVAPLSFGDEYYPEPDSAAGWRKNTDPGFMRSLGLDPDNVDAFGEYNLSITKTSHIKGRDYHKYTGALVIKDGWIVGEWYNREDGADYMNYLSSVGKTFALACFGIVEKDGQEGRVDHVLDRNSRVYDPRWLGIGFPLSDERKRDITFEQIFQHTSGLCPQKTADGRLIENGRDRWTDYASWVLGQEERWHQTHKLYFSPGRPEEFADRETWGAHEGAYSSVGFAHIGLVIQGLYGIPAHQFLWERLLRPLGFSGIDFHNPPNPPKIKWFSAGGLRMTTRDFGRFAYFLSRGGRWNGRLLVPDGWVDSFTSSPNYQNLRSNVDGYFGENYPADMFRLFGSGGNFAFVVPGYDLIAIRTSRTALFLQKVLERDFLRRVFLMIPGYVVD
ncbi:serine hydrolase [Gammaproteobacteria bacterium]|nr:serine hydrolase [Gammaproteobacteria bacterium]